ncbi:MAG: hypothetical protein GXO33_06770, partial [Epsilonproteobacteria bacterium]|nr:hypothetical protein [Campylobacterota bacterium]
MHIDARIKKGKVTKIGDTYVNVLLEDGTTGRLNFYDSMYETLEHFVSAYQTLLANGERKEFILKAEKESRSWYVSDDVARYRRDWEALGGDVIGKEFAFVVNSYVGDYAVKCHLINQQGEKTVIEAFLYKEDIVGPTDKTIQELLEIGDYLKAVVKEINVRQYQLRINIKEFRKRLQDEYENYKQKRR